MYAMKVHNKARRYVKCPGSLRLPSIKKAMAPVPFICSLRLSFFILYLNEDSIVNWNAQYWNEYHERYSRHYYVILCDFYFCPIPVSLQYLTSWEFCEKLIAFASQVLLKGWDKNPWKTTLTIVKTHRLLRLFYCHTGIVRLLLFLLKHTRKGKILWEKIC